MIKPKEIYRYYTVAAEREWSPKQQAVLDQGDLFEASVELEKIPYRFCYEFIDEDDCRHRYSISDWEIAELYRNCRDRSREQSVEAREQDALEGVRQKLEVDFLNNKDLYFLVGNLKNHKNTFMIIGLVYPKRMQEEQLSLF